MHARTAVYVAMLFATSVTVAAGCGSEPAPTGDGGHSHSHDGGGGVDGGSSDGGATDAGSQDAGTDDAGSTDAGSMDAGMPPVSFTTDIIPLFNAPPGNCNSCHVGTGSGGLDLTGTPSAIHARLVGVEAFTQNCKTLDRVTPNDPSQSFLYLKVTKTHPNNCGNAMPAPNGLPSAEAELIRHWIEQGAPNN